MTDERGEGRMWVHDWVFTSKFCALHKAQNCFLQFDVCNTNLICTYIIHYLYQDLQISTCWGVIYQSRRHRRVDPLATLERGAEELQVGLYLKGRVNKVYGVCVGWLYGLTNGGRRGWRWQNSKHFVGLLHI
jgi:hypothetical protein